MAAMLITKILDGEHESQAAGLVPAAFDIMVTDIRLHM